MGEELETQKYQKILNLLNQLNQDLIFYNRDLPLLKETLEQYIQVDQEFLGKELYEEIKKNIEACIQSLNQTIIPSIVKQINR